jgi:amino acid transporter
MFSTAGASNAMLYASSNLTSTLAEDGLFPPFFGTGSPLGPKAGLLISAGIVLVVANFVDLSAIASVGSASALVLFLLICASGIRLRTATGSNLAIVVAAMVVTLVVLALFAADTLENNPETFTAIIAVLVLAIVADAAWTWYRDNHETAVTEAN